MFKQMEAFAVVLYGALAIVLLFIAAVVNGAFYAQVGSVLCAGLTYLFQAVVFALPDDRSKRADAFIGLATAAICVEFALTFLLLIGGK